MCMGLQSSSLTSHYIEQAFGPAAELKTESGVDTPQMC